MHPGWKDLAQVFIVNACFSFSIGTTIGVLSSIFELKRSRKWYWHTCFYLLLFLLGGFAGTYIGYFFVELIFPHLSINIDTLLYNNSILALFFGTVIALIISGRIKIKEMANQLARKEINEERLKTLKAKAETEALKAKINPHFLFNTLNSIASLIDIDPQKAEEMVLKLSALFQSILEYSSITFIPIEKELHLVKLYLEIEKVRFEDRLNYQINCLDNIKNVMIPSLIIQPLVENAVKHGIANLLSQGKISINCMKINRSDILIQIKDNGNKSIKDQIQKGKGFGIKSVQEKLKLLYPKQKTQVNFSFQQGTLVEIIIPQRIKN